MPTVHVNHKADGGEDARLTVPLPWASAAIVRPSRRRIQLQLGAALLPRRRPLTRPVHGKQRSVPDPQEECRSEERSGWRWEESEHVTCDSTGQAPLARRPSRGNVFRETLVIRWVRRPPTAKASVQRSTGRAVRFSRGFTTNSVSQETHSLGGMRVRSEPAEEASTSRG